MRLFIDYGFARRRMFPPTALRHLRSFPGTGVDTGSQRLLLITYGADAMRGVMLHGASLSEILPQLAVLWGFIVVFFGPVCLSFKKKKTQ